MSNRRAQIKATERLQATIYLIGGWIVGAWALWNTFSLGVMPISDFYFNMMILSVGVVGTLLIIQWHYTREEGVKKTESKPGEFQRYQRIDPSTGEIDLSGEIPKGKLDFDPRIGEQE